MKPVITQTFLTSLELMSIDEAKYKVSKVLGMNCKVYDWNANVSLIATDNVLLWVKDGLVTEATAGDPSKLKYL